MSNNSSLPPPPPPLITDAETWIINTVFYMFGGITGVISNFIVFFTIIRDKNLRASSFFVQMCIVSLNRCTASGQDFILSVYRFLKLLNLANNFLDRWTCYSFFLALMHFSQVDFTFMAIVAIDRIIAIAKPMLYKSVTPRFVTILFGVIFVSMVLGFHMPGLFEAMPAQLACVNVISPMLPRVYYAGTLYALIASFFIAFSYIALVSFILMKYAKRKRANSGTQAQFDATMKKHMEILRPLLVMVVSTSICAIIPRCLFFFASFSNAASARMVAYAGALSNVDFNVMCCALLVRSSEFRTAFRKRFLNRGGTTLVVPFETGQKSRGNGQRSSIVPKASSFIR